VFWRPLHRWNEIDCRVDYYPSTQSDFDERHEKTRSWSPFNYELNMRRIKDSSVIGTAEGVRAELGDSDVLRTQFNSEAERTAFLIEEMLLSEEHVSMIPADRPTPPPPGSRTAQKLEN